MDASLKVVEWSDDEGEDSILYRASMDGPDLHNLWVCSRWSAWAWEPAELWLPVARIWEAGKRAQVELQAKEERR